MLRASHAAVNYWWHSPRSCENGFWFCMPIYEYECDTCGETLEVIHGVSAAPPETHEGCGGRLQRLTSAPTTRVKEGGGSTDTRHTSMLRFQDNQKIATDKKKRKSR